MCGIVGYVGKERCVEVLLDGLKNLEYRGYDSAGLALALPETGRIETAKEVGPLANLTSVMGRRDGDFFKVRAGVGHTRWATHGRPSEANAHPHTGGGDPLGPEVAVVHNGIIENHVELREELKGRGREFRSETDTEVIAHLLAERVAAGEALKEALAGTLKRLEGSFAVAAMSATEPETIVAARHQSPLVVGLGEGENFLASAVQALLGNTRRFLFVENGEIVTLTDSSVEIQTLYGQPVERETFEVDWSAEAIELGGYEDFMLKEIHEQPAALQATLAGRLDAGGAVDLSELNFDLSGIERIVVVACGTAYHAGLLGKYAIERLARLPVEVAVASEYRYADPVGDERTLVVAISQSGETTDTLAAVEAARGFGARVLAVTNTQGSLITREADAVLLTKAGPEVGVAATKTFLTQVAGLYLLALELAGTRGSRPAEELAEIGLGLRRSPEKVEEALGLLEGRVGEAVEVFAGARCALFLGRGHLYPAALEGALKLKEISYLPAEGYPAGEMKHGPIALVDEQCPVVAVLGEGTLREKTLSNVEETVARGARVIAIAREGDKAGRVARVVLPVPEMPEILSPLVSTVPLQLLAYHVAKARGLDVDKPRNLAKSVTVE
ncbi:MAG: Glutamine--fructose-6-phosphate aminotransferase [isomerizing] [uncultured Rubrobacteraceae bacterium]|uniref:Glutamine--fructose-6-phosphate aminotransferase [isomerizing] n=1 Tax=uncultured Rubrobacteraceae bacterium TaxID=349277 RepID=A0A6J4QNL9_9ACTN|nr:MAG: Glutamine--fructose-6-phosphate aminotransferase [isomerizing] [uncultured Rubrobacteraceae bacterium]